MAQLSALQNILPVTLAVSSHKNMPPPRRFWEWLGLHKRPPHLRDVLLLSRSEYNSEPRSLLG